MIGHCIGAAGSIESVAAVIGLKEDFIFPSINSEDVHHKISDIISTDRIPQKVLQNTAIKIVAKASFGFGDVNCCILFKKWENE